MTRTVQIEAKLDRPLELEPKEFTLSNYVDYKLTELEKGKKYAISFKNKPGLGGSYRGRLKLKTNYPEMPELTIWIRGRFLTRPLPGQNTPGLSKTP